MAKGNASEDLDPANTLSVVFIHVNWFFLFFIFILGLICFTCWVVWVWFEIQSLFDMFTNVYYSE